MGGFWKVRTELSDYSWFVVHFFDARQRNEPKKTRVGVAPLRTLPWSRATRKTLCVLLNTRGCQSVQTLLSPFKENGENIGVSTERKSNR